MIHASDVLLLIAAFLCALTAGLVFTFTVVVMPGLRTLSDRDFLRAFRVMDRVIQQNEPRFLVVWVGSVVALVAAVVVGFRALEGGAWMVLLVSAATYLGGVQLPTIVVNVPMNNRLQALNLDELNAADLQAEREAFERRWTVWNAVRTVCACVSVSALLVVIAGG